MIARELEALADQIERIAITGARKAAQVDGYSQGEGKHHMQAAANGFTVVAALRSLARDTVK